MEVAFDLDGTLCRRNNQVYMEVANDVLQSGIPSKRLGSMSRADFLNQPELQARKEMIGDEQFRRALGWIFSHVPFGLAYCSTALMLVYKNSLRDTMLIITQHDILLGINRGMMLLYNRQYSG